MHINKSHGAAVRRYSSTKTGLQRAPSELWPQLGGEEVRGTSSKAVSAGVADTVAVSSGVADSAAVETVAAPPVPGVQKPPRWVGKRKIAGTVHYVHKQEPWCCCTTVQQHKNRSPQYSFKHPTTQALSDSPAVGHRVEAHYIWISTCRWACSMVKNNGEEENLVLPSLLTHTLSALIWSLVNVKQPYYIERHNYNIIREK